MYEDQFTNDTSMFEKDSYYTGGTTPPPQQPDSYTYQGDYSYQERRTTTTHTRSSVSVFHGGMIELFGIVLLGALITLVTFGICFPWAYCMYCKWEAEHTVISGHNVVFNGTAGQLMGKWIFWLILGMITSGLSYFWAYMSLKKWKISHTVLV